jgi:hypothetical protein
MIEELRAQRAGLNENQSTHAKRTPKVKPTAAEMEQILSNLEDML